MRQWRRPVKRASPAFNLHLLRLPRHRMRTTKGTKGAKKYLCVLLSLAVHEFTSYCHAQLVERGATMPARRTQTTRSQPSKKETASRQSHATPPALTPRQVREEARRESGRPGGGQGRTDVV